jgi:hypothetical protein
MANYFSVALTGMTRS